MSRLSRTIRSFCWLSKCSVIFLSKFKFKERERDCIIQQRTEKNSKDCWLSKYSMILFSKFKFKERERECIIQQRTEKDSKDYWLSKRSFKIQIRRKERLYYKHSIIFSSKFERKRLYYPTEDREEFERWLLIK